MSLTSLIREPSIAALFQEVVRSPDSLPNLPLLAPPRSQNFRRVGTAFDYLLRFHLQRVNPEARSSQWIAEKARFQIGSLPADADPTDYLENPIFRRRNDLATEYLEDARVYHRAYLRTGNLTDDLLVALLRLAGLDVAYRAGPDKVDWEALEHIEPSDVDDLRSLYDLAQNVDFRAEKACFLNPTFNMASRLVGGADADVILDSRIIDIKTTKDLRLDRRDLYQLVGYYLLLLLDGISVTPNRGQGTESILYAETVSEINELAIYFSRHGHLHKFPVAELLSSDTLRSFAVRFVELACHVKRDRLRYWRNFRGSLALSLRDVVLATDASSKTRQQLRAKKKRQLTERSTRTRAKATRAG